ncbi:hypothetical protein BDZ91DRAFT_764870 [Kalaharituber pfeilii]|nr:hypothetical protein BDZ91DRAFT_764870 [Kalaharituber pfeilii]
MLASDRRGGGGGEKEEDLVICTTDMYEYLYGASQRRVSTALFAAFGSSKRPARRYAGAPGAERPIPFTPHAEVALNLLAQLAPLGSGAIFPLPSRNQAAGRKPPPRGFTDQCQTDEGPSYIHLPTDMQLRTATVSLSYMDRLPYTAESY